MDTQTETAKETINPAKPADLIYGVDDRPPFRDAFFAGQGAALPCGTTKQCNPRHRNPFTENIA